MPQMSPLKWLNLYIFFCSIFLIFCMLNYYSFMPSLPSNPSYSHSQTISMKWKW